MVIISGTIESPNQVLSSVLIFNFEKYVKGAFQNAFKLDSRIFGF
jgi:hypothetical protein